MNIESNTILIILATIVAILALSLCALKFEHLEKTTSQYEDYYVSEDNQYPSNKNDLDSSFGEENDIRSCKKRCDENPDCNAFMYYTEPVGCQLIQMKTPQRWKGSKNGNLKTFYKKETQV